VAAVAKGHIMNFLTDLEKDCEDLDQHMTEIMMAQDFHDLTGQVIAKVVTLATSIEEQMVQLLIQTAPPHAALAAKPATAAGDYSPALSGPVVNPEGNADVVTDQSEVDDLLASLGF
jgi:chemotaxis protein CheZ